MRVGVYPHTRARAQHKSHKRKKNQTKWKEHEKPQTFCCSKPIRQSDAEQVTFFGDDNPRQKHFVVRKYCFSFQPDGDDRFQASIGITGAETSDLLSTKMDPNPSENRADLLLMPRIKWSASSLRGTGRRVYPAMQTTSFPLKNIMIADGWSVRGKDLAQEQVLVNHRFRFGAPRRLKFFLSACCYT